MTIDVAPIGPTSLSAAHDLASAARAPRPVPAVRDDVSRHVPPSPPPEVLDAIDAAARAYQTLRAHGRELRFSQDEATGRLTIEVRDLDGNVLRTIPPSKLLDVATGRSLD